MVRTGFICLQRNPYPQERICNHTINENKWDIVKYVQWSVYMVVIYIYIFITSIYIYEIFTMHN